jgi:uncharacterized phiE125 gp8 family phage protein
METPSHVSPAREVQGGAVFVNRERKMPAIPTQPPETEPLTLDEAKAFLRVEHTDEDELIASLIKAARMAVEAATRRALITQGFRIVLDAWPVGDRIPSPVSPLRSLTGARVRAANGSAADIDLMAFTIDTASNVIHFDRGLVGEPGQPIAGIEIEITAGYGEDASSVPEPLRQAMRFLVARHYAQRDRVEKDDLPETVHALIAPYRAVSL